MRLAAEKNLDVTARAAAEIALAFKSSSSAFAYC
jgi:hypothetical protein